MSDETEPHPRLIAASMKRALAKTYPAIKSSHLTEAIARGLGWPTHAALLKADLGTVFLAHVFIEFLGQRGYAVSADDFFEAALAAVRTTATDKETA